MIEENLVCQGAAMISKFLMTISHRAMSVAMRAGRVEGDGDELGRSEHDGPKLFGSALLGPHPGSDPLEIEKQFGQLEHTALGLCSNARSGAVVDEQQSEDLTAQAVEERSDERSSRTTTMGGNDASAAPVSSGNDNVHASAPRTCLCRMQDDGECIAWGVHPALCETHEGTLKGAPTRTPLAAQINARSHDEDQGAPCHGLTPQPGIGAPMGGACARWGANHALRARFVDDISCVNTPLASPVRGRARGAHEWTALLGTSTPPRKLCSFDAGRVMAGGAPPKRNAAWNELAIHLSTRIAVRNTRGRACAAPPCVRAHMRTCSCAGRYGVASHRLSMAAHVRGLISAKPSTFSMAIMHGMSLRRRPSKSTRRAAARTATSGCNPSHGPASPPLLRGARESNSHPLVSVATVTVGSIIPTICCISEQRMLLYGHSVCSVREHGQRATLAGTTPTWQRNEPMGGAATRGGSARGSTTGTPGGATTARHAEHNHHRERRGTGGEQPAHLRSYAQSVARLPVPSSTGAHMRTRARRRGTSATAHFHHSHARRRVRECSRDATQCHVRWWMTHAAWNKLMHALHGNTMSATRTNKCPTVVRARELLRILHEGQKVTPPAARRNTQNPTHRRRKGHGAIARHRQLRMEQQRQKWRDTCRNRRRHRHRSGQIGHQSIDNNIDKEYSTLDTLAGLTEGTPQAHTQCALTYVWTSLALGSYIRVPSEGTSAQGRGNKRGSGFLAILAEMSKPSQQICHDTNAAQREWGRHGKRTPQKKDGHATRPINNKLTPAQRLHMRLRTGGHLSHKAWNKLMHALHGNTTQGTPPCCPNGHVNAAAWLPGNNASGRSLFRCHVCRIADGDGHFTQRNPRHLRRGEATHARWYTSPRTRSTIAAEAAARTAGVNRGGTAAIGTTADTPTTKYACETTIAFQNTQGSLRGDEAARINLMSTLMDKGRVWGTCEANADEGLRRRWEAGNTDVRVPYYTVWAVPQQAGPGAGIALFIDKSLGAMPREPATADAGVGVGTQARTGGTQAGRTTLSTDTPTVKPWQCACAYTE